MKATISHRQGEYWLSSGWDAAAADDEPLGRNAGAARVLIDRLRDDPMAVRTLRRFLLQHTGGLANVRAMDARAVC